MSFPRFLLIYVAAAGGAMAPALAQITTSMTTRDYLFPPVGLGGGETASITVVNTATALSSGGTSVATATAPSCTGTISFTNAVGAIGTPPASFAVGSQQFKTVTLPFASAELTGTRGEIQGKIAIATSTAAPCSPMASLETYDSSIGATHAVLSASQVNVAPVGPILPFGDRSGR
ncbi:MAG: hypothetical protein ABSH09_35220 [Bryobacteraceae bacterium]|jgi:hypothetical protein